MWKGKERRAIRVQDGRRNGLFSLKQKKRRKRRQGRIHKRRRIEEGGREERKGRKRGKGRRRDRGARDRRKEKLSTSQNKDPSCKIC